MKNKNKLITTVNLLILSVVLFIYAILRFKIVFFRDYAKGDEYSFLQTFKVFLNKGFYQTNILGNSTPFNFISYVFYQFSENQLISLRLTSLFFGILTIFITFFYYKKNYNLPKLYLIISFLTAINTIVVMSWVFKGINDQILSVLTLFFFIIVFKIKKKPKNYKILYVVTGVILSFFIITRKMSILMLPAFMFVIVKFYYSKKDSLKLILNKTFLILIPFLLNIIIFNFPSLLEKNQLSFHNKPTGNSNISWRQIVYLAVKGEENGDLKYGKYFSNDYVEKYVKENGENSLPQTYSEAIFFDFKTTVKVFLKGVIYEIKPFTRLLGIAFIFGLFLLVYSFLKKDFLKLLNHPPLMFSVIYFFTLCFVIVSFMQTRWFSNILILLPVILIEKIYNFKIDKKLGKNFDFIFINAQIISLVIMNIPYIYKNFKIIF